MIQKTAPLKNIPQSQLSNLAVEPNVLWKCETCGIYAVREKRGSYSKTERHYTSYAQWMANLGCKHPSVVCDRCGRPLSAHKSVKNGRGPVCEKIMGVLAK